MVAGKTILLLRGKTTLDRPTGRSLLATTLRARHAHVIELVCYQRHRGVLDAQIGLRLHTLMRESMIEAWIVGSIETLESLLANLLEAHPPPAAAHRNLMNQHLLVPHHRVAESARAHGFKHVTVTSLQPNAILSAITANSHRP